MKCAHCGSEGSINFLGIWYTQVGEVWMLNTHYGCVNCFCISRRPVNEDSFYYRKADGSIVMRPTFNPARGENRLLIIDPDPGFRWRTDHT